MFTDHLVCLHLEDLHDEAARQRFGGPQPWDRDRPLFDLAAVARHLRTYCLGGWRPVRVYARDPLRAVYQTAVPPLCTEALFCEVATLTGDPLDVDLAVMFDVTALALTDTAVRAVTVGGRAPVYPPLAAALARAGKAVRRVALEVPLESPCRGTSPAPGDTLVVPRWVWQSPYYLDPLPVPAGGLAGKLAIESIWVAG